MIKWELNHTTHKTPLWNVLKNVQLQDENTRNHGCDKSHYRQQQNDLIYSFHGIPLRGQDAHWKLIIVVIVTSGNRGY